MKRRRGPSKNFRRAVTQCTRYGRAVGTNGLNGRLLLQDDRVPQPRLEMNKDDLAGALCFDRARFIAMMDAAEMNGLTGPSRLGDNLYRDPAYHVATVAPGMFREDEIHAIDKATRWAPGGAV